MAFINIENLRQNSNEGLNKSAKVLFNKQSGNTDKTLSSFSTLNSYLNGKNEYIFIANKRYGESFGEKDTDDGAIHIRYTKEFESPHYIETYLQHQYNKFQALESRNIFGLGYRFSKKYFHMGIGFFHEDETIVNLPDESGLRGNAYFSFVKETKLGLEFSSILYLQPSFARSADNRTILNCGISQKVSDYIHLNIEYENVYDQRPPEDIKVYDSSIMVGVSFR